MCASIYIYIIYLKTYTHMLTRRIRTSTVCGSQVLYSASLFGITGTGTKPQEIAVWVFLDSTHPGVRQRSTVLCPSLSQHWKRNEVSGYCRQRSSRQHSFMSTTAKSPFLPCSLPCWNLTKASEYCRQHSSRQHSPTHEHDDEFVIS